MVVCNKFARILCCKCIICVNRSIAGHDLGKFYSEKNKQNPLSVCMGSHTKFIWNCQTCHHEVYCQANSVLSSGRIPCDYCNGGNKLCDDEDCQMCFDNSVANHDKKEFYSSKNKLPARLVRIASNTKCICECPTCHDEFMMSPNKLKYIDCKHCSSSTICKKECKPCYLKSFASIDFSKNWFMLNKDTPRDISKFSKEKRWFECFECFHVYEAVVGNLTRGAKCPYCHHYKICGVCTPCRKKSFITHPKKDFVVDKTIDLSLIVRNSAIKTDFMCENGHTFNTSFLVINCGRWCSFCKNKTMVKIFTWLIDTYAKSERIVREHRFKWCKNIKTLPFDYVFLRVKLIIEVDGEQHFRNIGRWKSEYTKVVQRDIDKMAMAIDRGYSFIRISQEDILYDRIDWQYLLDSHIKKYKTPKVMYISSDQNKYNYHKSQMKLIYEDQ